MGIDGLEGPYEFNLEEEDPEDVLPYRPRPRPQWQGTP